MVVVGGRGMEMSMIMQGGVGAETETEIEIVGRMNFLDKILHLNPHPDTETIIPLEDLAPAPIRELRIHPHPLTMTPERRNENIPTKIVAGVAVEFRVGVGVGATNERRKNIRKRRERERRRRRKYVPPSSQTI